MAFEEAAAAGQELCRKLKELIEPVVRSEGLLLVELQYRPEGRGNVLRLYVDRPEGGVTLEECAVVSRQVSDLLDVEDLLPGRYHLEVSSPGLTRQLKTRRDFELFAGRPARLVVRNSQGGSETLDGRLKGLLGEEVLLDCGGQLRAVPLSQVAKAKLTVA